MQNATISYQLATLTKFKKKTFHDGRALTNFLQE